MRSTKIEFKSSRGRLTQTYIEPPSAFMLERQQQLLPDWEVPIANVIVVLQQSRILLKSTNPEVMQEKNYLREQFWRLGCNLVFRLRDSNYISDIFDPRTGYPWLSSRGEITLNDNAVVAALLDFPVTAYKNCSLIEHPQWKEAVYPSTIVSNAPLKVLTSVLRQGIESLCTDKVNISIN